MLVKGATGAILPDPEMAHWWTCQRPPDGCPEALEHLISGLSRRNGKMATGLANICLHQQLVHCLQNSHNGCPIAHLAGWGMGWHCEFRVYNSVQSVIVPKRGAVNIQKPTNHGMVLGVFCYLEVWSVFYIHHCSALSHTLLLLVRCVCVCFCKGGGTIHCELKISFMFLVN